MWVVENLLKITVQIMLRFVIYSGIALSVANVAICNFFLDWRLKSASGDFFAA
jgi:hypothetical protein